ncbi:GntR family transcriptional regulator [Deinococcus radiotolerans]|uniref:Transcriptional regulator, GntR family protein n=1 Tax=Deinococcus radiotolerans TaxID=1309407 RepID=A0ABQ2FHN3_9DEIO|nr:GntR family transcriptional regulator [Deinococcus radiotolerans]GGK99567.1 putative transcriptional regulator, GntR family protein [Deinococcus radiotolerans]
MPIPPTAPQRPRSLAREDVYAQLSTWIIDGTLHPEEPLRDQDIAEQLGVSRTPVREALRRLEDEGLIETALNRWTRVAPLHPGQATELYPVVEALEELALRLAAAHLTPADLTLLRAANQQLAQATERRDAGAAVAADVAFHAVWITRSGNQALQQTLHGLKRKLRRIERAYFDAASAGQASVAEHDLIITALHHGQTDQAVMALRANWQGSLQRLLNRPR